MVDEHLVPAFRTADETALQAQNRWARRELGLLVLSALLVTATSVQAAVGEEGWPGVVVAALGGVSSVLSNATKSADARGVFLRHRQEAERLRSLIWTFLSVPGRSSEAHRLLEQQVAGIRLDTAQGTLTESTGEPDRRREPETVATEARDVRRAVAPDARSEQLLAVYRIGRVHAQGRWYTERQQEFELAERQGRRLRTGLLVLATVLGALAPAVEPEIRPWLGVAATVATAASAVITGWMRLQAFDVRARLYEVTAARLDLADAYRPAVPDPELAREHIEACEHILMAEHGLWSEQTPRQVREAAERR